MKKLSLVLGLALGWSAPALAQPVTPAPTTAPAPALTPTTYGVQLYAQGAQAGEPARVRIEEVDAGTWRAWITYQGQTYVGQATPLHGGRSVFAASGLVPESASTPVRRGAAQRLNLEEPAPQPPSSGEGYQPGVPAMMLIRLESGGGQAIVTLRDARERIIGQGAGGVDWAGEADRLAERLDEARADLEQTNPLDRTPRQELRVEALAEQHRHVQDAAAQAALASGDLDQIQAASDQTRDRLAELRERYEALEDPHSREAHALSEDLRRTENLLRHTQQARSRLEVAEIESRELERIAPAADQIRERLAQLREAYVAEEDPQGPRGQVLSEEMRETAQLLEHAVQQRERAEAAEIESRDLDRVSEGVDHVRERLARLREQYVRAEPHSPSAELLSQDMRRTSQLLDHAVQQRERLEATEVESGSPRRTAAVADRVRERLAELREHYVRAEPHSPTAELLSQDMRRTSQLLDRAVQQRTRAEAAGIESESPRTVARATAQVQGRLARLRQQYTEVEPRSPSAELLTQDMRRTGELLRHGLERRDRVETQAIESGDPARIEPVVSELESRLNTAEIRLAQLPGLTPTHELLRQEQERTSRLLRVAHERQLTRDEQDVRSVNPERVEALRVRLEARVAHLDDLANHWRPAGGEHGTPRWLTQQRQATRDLLRRLPSN